VLVAAANVFVLEMANLSVPDIDGSVDPKNFLYLNRHFRPFRFLLFLELYRRGLLKNSYCSFYNNDWYTLGANALYTPDYMVSKLVEYGGPLTGLIEYGKTVVPHMIFPWVLDNFENIYPYFAATKFSVICETRCNETAFQPTEKVFRAIKMGHPFVVFSTPGFLHRFREMGYRTFSPYIDESYDDNPDHHDRMMAVADQVEKLNSKMADVDNLWWKVPEIFQAIQFNKSHLSSRCADTTRNCANLGKVMEIVNH
jgi:hypothetical protein